MTDSELRTVWMNSDPKWRTDADAAEVCRSICDLIIQRATESTILGTVENQIMYLCHEIGIPKSEFEEVQRNDRERS
jgi:hypothetical protein